MKRGINKSVYVAMSGGVDSSVTAALLKKQGFDVVGVFMQPWSPGYESMSKERGACLWRRDREEALRAASVLDIPFLTWDFSREYKKRVADYMIREYRAGKTPNPDVMCNKEIKFGLFLKRALKEGADYIATGHYVRVVKSISPSCRSAFLAKSKVDFTYRLLKAKDKNKDQSYFLWTLKQEQLKYCLFPIGNYTKPEVRKIAKKFKLPNHNKKDSQGVCFIGPLNMGNFLKDYIKTKKGKIINTDGEVVGEHDGIYYYTIGQRHGLDIKNGIGPHYITGKDSGSNIIYVGQEKDLLSRKALVYSLSWVNGGLQLPSKIGVRTRYRAPIRKAILKRSGEVLFDRNDKSVTPGQSAVFYKGQELVGGGIII